MARLIRWFLFTAFSSDTAFNVAEEKADRFTANYERAPDKSLRLIDDPATSTYLSPPSFLSGGGGLTGTTADYLRFCEMLRNGGKFDDERIIGSRTLDLMRHNHLPGGRDLAQLAVGVVDQSERLIWSHPSSSRQDVSNPGRASHRR